MNAAEKAVLELEHRYWQCMIDKDVDGALALTDNPCIVTGAQGVSTLDHETYRKLMSGGHWQLKSFSFEDVAARQLSDDVVVLGYKVREELVVDGKPLSMVASDASTWVKRGGKWVCALHTESVEGDPFGRK